MGVRNEYVMLNDSLLKQSFDEGAGPLHPLQAGQAVAQMYARMENAMSVLSDIGLNKSYIYHQGIADQFGLEALTYGKEIDSIWEKDILDRVHPDDLLQKHSLELRFFHFMKQLSIGERMDYQAQCRIRMMDSKGAFVPVRHRIFYIGSAVNGSVRLALCLYTVDHEEANNRLMEGIIVNTRSGVIVAPGKDDVKELLSAREKEVLSLIRDGMNSKTIATQLSISLNTVNRHRQNILEKLKVANSIEACKIAERMGLI